MTGAEKFVAALQRRVGPGGPKSVQDHWDSQRDEWLEDLQGLLQKIETWLEPAAAAGAVKLTQTNHTMHEPDLGTYLAPGLRVELLVDPPIAVEIRPRGCRVVGLVETEGKRVTGAAGRIDIERGVEREIVLRFKRPDGVSWQSFAGGEKRELDQEVFLELLSRVADLDLDGE